MPRQQLQAPRVEQQSALAAGLRASRAACLRMGELLVLAQGRDVFGGETETVVGDGGGSGRLLGGAVGRRRHGGAAAVAASAMLLGVVDVLRCCGRVLTRGAHVGRQRS